MTRTSAAHAGRVRPVRVSRDLQHRSGGPIHQRRLHGALAGTRDSHQHEARGSRRDNIFVERLWRTIKYEEVCLHAYATVSEARAGLTRYLTLYNSRRPHSSLADQTPDQAYFAHMSPAAVAA